MKKKKNPFFEGIMEGAREAVAIAKGTADPSTYRIHVPPDVDVRKIRKSLKLTQQEFAMRFRLARLRDLEQKGTRPDSAIRAYLKVIQKNPEAWKKPSPPEPCCDSFATKDASTL
jgi:putative transcriptional regulator